MVFFLVGIGKFKNEKFLVEFMEYQLKKEDLEKCFKFAIEYHLDQTKLSSNRTTGQYRGLGGIIDNFLIGKIIELGVVKILEKYTKKEVFLDFEIHPLKKENVSDPDIIKIKEGGSERGPKLYIEIKNISPLDRWIGLTQEQFKAILKNKIIDADSSKVYIVYATLVSKDEENDKDPFGSYLKSELNLEELNKFCDVENLYVKIQYILNGKELKDKGIVFNEGSFLYETNIFQELNKKTAKKILDEKNNLIYEKIVNLERKLPVIMRNNKPPSKEIGEFEYEGEINIYKKKNEKSERMYLYCKTDVLVFNKVLGIFKLEKGKIYDCFFTTVGMNPTLKRNNIWVAHRNLFNIIKEDPMMRMKGIAKNI